MSKTADPTARRKAEELWDSKTRREAQVLSERQVAQRAEAAKTARLRELRLAKETADRQAAGQGAPSRRGRRAAASK
jgi:predicted RNA-binding protein with PUA-like domain